MSLLLESLKKAALEKKEREKYTDSPQVAPQVQPQILVQPNNPEQPVSQPLSMATENESVENQVVENQTIEKTTSEKLELEKPDVELEFNIDEVEFVIEPSDAPALIDLDHKEPVTEVQSEAKKETPQEVTETQSSRSEKTESAEISSTEKTTKANSFTPESGKAALAALLEKNNKVAHSNKVRRYVLIGALFTTGVIVLGGYYYFLNDNSSSLSPANNGGLYVHQSNNDSSLVENPVDTAEVPVVEQNGAVEGTDIESASVETPIVETTSTQISNVVAADVEKQSQSVRANSVSQSSIIEQEPIEKPIEKQSVKKQVAPVKNAENKSIAVNSRPIESFIQSQPQMEDLVVQTVREAYRAYQQGRWAEAQALYQDALMQDSHNRDALLGSAAVAVRLGNINEALGFYQQQLERDPKDEYALSGIMALSLDGNKVQLLSDVDKLLQEKPAAVHLLLLKGRLLANQQQWAAAQEVFFDAWRYDKNNADIAYNLAICLDRLSQPKEAMRFYQMALSLKTPASSFSADVVEKRLASLTRSTP
jgi:tetratricopeptide (TPR) repeat protein